MEHSPTWRRSKQKTHRKPAHWQDPQGLDCPARALKMLRPSVIRTSTSPRQPSVLPCRCLFGHHPPHWVRQMREPCLAVSPATLAPQTHSGLATRSHCCLGTGLTPTRHRPPLWTHLVLPRSGRNSRLTPRRRLPNAFARRLRRV